MIKKKRRQIGTCIMISSKIEFPKQVINFEKIKNFKYLSDESCRKCLLYNLPGLKLCLLDMLREGESSLLKIPCL